MSKNNKKSFEDVAIDIGVSFVVCVAGTTMLLHGVGMTLPLVPTSVIICIPFVATWNLTPVIFTSEPVEESYEAESEGYEVLRGKDTDTGLVWYELVEDTDTEVVGELPEGINATLAA